MQVTSGKFPSTDVSQSKTVKAMRGEIKVTWVFLLLRSKCGMCPGEKYIIIRIMQRDPDSQATLTRPHPFRVQ